VFQVEIHEDVQALLNTCSDGIYVVDTDRTIQYWNEAASQITGRFTQEMIGSSCPESFRAHVNRDHQPLCDTGCPLMKSIHEQRPCRLHPLLLTDDNDAKPLWVRTAPIRRDGNVVGAIQVFSVSRNERLAMDHAVFPNLRAPGTSRQLLRVDLKVRTL
jgi:PAS domain S-box-containing protein